MHPFIQRIIFTFKLLVVSSLFIFNLQAVESYVLQDATEAEQARWDLIQKAKNEIFISYFIYQNDKIGLQLLAQLYQAKKNNPLLDIRLIMDGSANYIHKNILYYIEQNGIKILEFHSLPKLFPGLKNINIVNFFKAIFRANTRMHDKILITDSENIIIGGRNMQQEYFDYNDHKNFYDLDLYANAPMAAAQAKKYFIQLWQSKHLSPIRYKEKDQSEESLINAQNTIEQQLNFQNAEHVSLDSWRKNVVPLEQEKILLHHAFDSTKNKIQPKLLANRFFNRLTELANTEIIFETPYFLPTKYFYRMLKKLKRKQVNVTVITNSYCSNDMDVVAGAYELRKKKILRSGVKLFEYTGDNYLHAKALTIDDTSSMVGTFNLDPRSTYTNSELVLEVASESINNTLNEKFRRDMAQSKEIMLDKRGRAPKRDKDCEKTNMQKFLYQIGKYGSIFPFLYMQL